MENGTRSLLLNPISNLLAQAIDWDQVPLNIYMPKGPAIAGCRPLDACAHLVDGPAQG